MTKNWKYVVRDEEGNTIKGYFMDSERSASQISWVLEMEGYEVLSVSCLANFPFMNFIPIKTYKEKRSVCYNA